MHRFESLGVPPDIVALIAKAPLLRDESNDDYFGFVAGLFEDYGATHRMEFMVLTRYADCYWEIKRLEDARARIISHWLPKARIALVKDHTPEAYEGFDQLLAKQYPDGVDDGLLNGRAIILASHKNQLAYLDQQIASRQVDCDKLLQSLAVWRATLVPRNRESQQSRTTDLKRPSHE